VTTSPYARRDDGTGPGRLQLDAGRLWMGGLATALVAALVALVGVLIARGLFDVPVLAPTEEGTLGNASTARLAGLAAVAALAATGLMHLLLVCTPRPWRFFAWIVWLLIVVAVVAPFTTGAKLDTKVATAAINLAVGTAIASLVPAVARSATRLGRVGADLHQLPAGGDVLSGRLAVRPAGRPLRPRPGVQGRRFHPARRRLPRGHPPGRRVL
jgi:Family of unknown function (DUF6069)